MSKYVKDLISNDIRRRLEDVEDALLVNVIGMDANATVLLRQELRSKGIQLLVVKNSLAKRATEGTRLSAAFDGVEGSLALVWGGEDIISVAKEITRIAKKGRYKGFESRGGVMEGQKLTSDGVKQISKLPNREEQLSILSGQILSPGANLVAQLLGPGAALASQLKELSEKEDK